MADEVHEVVGANPTTTGADCHVLNPAIWPDPAESVRKYKDPVELPEQPALIVHQLWTKKVMVSFAVRPGTWV